MRTRTRVYKARCIRSRWINVSCAERNANDAFGRYLKRKRARRTRDGFAKLHSFCRIRARRNPQSDVYRKHDLRCSAPRRGKINNEFALVSFNLQTGMCRISLRNDSCRRCCTTPRSEWYLIMDGVNTPTAAVRNTSKDETRCTSITQFVLRAVRAKIRCNYFFFQRHNIQTHKVTTCFKQTEQNYYAYTVHAFRLLNNIPVHVSFPLIRREGV